MFYVDCVKQYYMQLHDPEFFKYNQFQIQTEDKYKFLKFFIPYY